MALYLGVSEKLNIKLNNKTYSMRVNSIVDLIENGTLFKDVNEKLLRDSNEQYLLFEEGK